MDLTPRILRPRHDAEDSRTSRQKTLEERLREALRPALRNLPDGPCRLVGSDRQPARRVILDTFDWRLHGRDRCLVRREGAGPPELWLETVAGRPLRRQRFRVPKDDDDGTPGFMSRELPPGPLAAAIAELAGLRRLLPLLVWQPRREPLEVQDPLEHAVARVEVLTGTVSIPESTAAVVAARGDPSRPTEAELPPAVRIHPVRGWDEVFVTLVKALQGAGWEPVEADFLDLALPPLGHLAGKPPGGAAIEPDTPAGEATRRILRSLLATLRAHEEGTRRDLDTEFLHQFRIAIRRTRSALGQIRGVLPSEVVERFQEDFRWLGKATGPTRDLDVYLLGFPEYQAALPEAAAHALDPLRDFLVRQRGEERARLGAALSSRRYRRLVDDWTDFLDPDDDSKAAGEPPDHAREAIRRVAARRIWKAWRRLLKKGRAIDDDTPVERLHRLRVDGKKLRYLLEFFRHLFPEDEMEAAIHATKKLQDNLGDLQDYGVQQSQLEDFARRMIAEREATAARPPEDGDGNLGEEPATAALPPAETIDPVSTLLAMGRLLERLGRREARERKHFAHRFGRLDRSRNRRRFRALFKDT